jgi:hypothetical protein
MSETVNDYIPGRSLLAEMTDLREQMAALKAAMLQLVELQREMHTKLDAVLNSHIKEEEATWPANLNSN